MRSPLSLRAGLGLGFLILGLSGCYYPAGPAYAPGAAYTPAPVHPAPGYSDGHHAGGDYENGHHY